MSLGFEAAGFDTLVAIDNNPVHVATHEWNFPLTRSLCADIETLSAEDILTSAKEHWSERYPDESWPGDIDCIFGGPSCQGFSEIGRRNPQDERNSLLSAFARHVAAIKPKYFVMENVPGLLAPVNDSIRTEALEIFAADYSLTTERPFILSAGDFGVPQARRRVIVVGNRKDVPPVSAPVATCAKVTVAEALDDLRCLELYRSLATKDSVQLSATALAKMEARRKHLCAFTAERAGLGARVLRAWIQQAMGPDYRNVSGAHSSSQRGTRTIRSHAARRRRAGQQASETQGGWASSDSAGRYGARPRQLHLRPPDPLPLSPGHYGQGSGTPSFLPGLVPIPRHKMA